MIRYQITDRRLAGGIEPLVRSVSRNLMDGIDLVQIREKDLEGRELASLVRRIVSLPNPHGTRILVNARVDVAMAGGAHGVHLPSDGLPPERIRKIAPADFVIGVSCHSEAELLAAQDGHADFAVLGPIFLSQSLKAGQSPLGLNILEKLAVKSRIPVLALGGVSHKNAALCLRAGAAGVAGISMFQ